LLKRVEAQSPAPTVEWVQDQFQMAGRAIRATRLTARDIPQGARSGWPEIVRSHDDLYAALVGASDSEAKEMVADRYVARPAATREDIAAQDRCIVWLLWLPKKRQAVVLGSALGIPRRRIGDIVGVDRTTLWRWEKDAYEEIVYRLKNSLQHLQQIL
jgi:hypothetical protein